MSGYLLAVMGTVLLCAVLTAITPNGKTAGVIKGMAKMACLLAIVAPIPAFLSGEKTLDDNFSKSVLQTDDNFIQYYGSMRIKQSEETLEREICEKFSIQVKIAITVSSTDTVESIRVTLMQELDEEVRTAVWEYLTKTYCSEVLIE